MNIKSLSINLDLHQELYIATTYIFAKVIHGVHQELHIYTVHTFAKVIHGLSLYCLWKQHLDVH